MGFLEDGFDIEIMGEVFHFDPSEIHEEPAERIMLLTAAQFAERAGVSPMTVRRWIAAGKIVARKDPLTRCWYIDEREAPPTPTAYGRPRGSRIEGREGCERGPFPQTRSQSVAKTGTTP